MAYTSQNFKDGNPLTGAALQAMNDALTTLYAHGIGDNSLTQLSDINNASDNGVYGANPKTKNIPIAEYGVCMAVSLDAATKKQIFLTLARNGQANLVAVRTMLSGTWQPWEWINPPALDGVEYRTTERWRGKPVYCKLIDCGAAPASGLKRVYHNLDVDKIIRVHGIVGVESMPIVYNGSNNVIGSSEIATVYANASTIYIWTTSDKSAQTAYVTLYYTRN